MEKILKFWIFILHNQIHRKIIINMYINYTSRKQDKMSYKIFIIYKICF